MREEERKGTMKKETRWERERAGEIEKLRARKKDD